MSPSQRWVKLARLAITLLTAIALEADSGLSGPFS
jgi:hypothetical protein